MKKIIEAQGCENQLCKIITVDLDGSNETSFFVSEQVNEELEIGVVIDGIESKEY